VNANGGVTIGIDRANKRDDRKELRSGPELIQSKYCIQNRLHQCRYCSKKTSFPEAHLSIPHIHFPSLYPKTLKINSL
jgi:hypothetical protein